MEMELLKPYESYKGTDVAWLSEVPSGWEVVSLAKMVTMQSGKNLTSIDISEDGKYPVYGGNGFRGYYDRYNTSGECVLVGRQGALCGNAHFVANKFWATDHAVVTREKENCLLRYIYFLVIAMNLNQYATASAQPGISVSKILRIKTICPSIEEQDQIVKFLDWKTSKINALVTAKKKQIELLKEQIEAITSLVIKNAEQKTKLKYVVEYPRNFINRESEKEYNPIGVLNRGRGIFKKGVLKGDELGDSLFFKIESDCLLISGQFAWEGSIAITNREHTNCVASHRYYTIKGKKSYCCTEFLWAFFRTQLGDYLLNECSHGAAGRNKPLNFNELMNQYIPIPSLEIQEKIKYKVKQLLLLMKQIDKYQKLMNEYKTSLISSVVTGKVDVRGVEVPAFAMAEDSAECVENEEMEE